MKNNLKKIMDKSKLGEMVQESTLDLKVNGKDMTSFSLAHDTKNNTDYINGRMREIFLKANNFQKKTLNYLQQKD